MLTPKQKLFHIALIWRDLSKKEFAVKLGVSRQAVSKVVSGKMASTHLSIKINNFTKDALNELQAYLEKQ